MTVEHRAQRRRANRDDAKVEVAVSEVISYVLMRALMRLSVEVRHLKGSLTLSLENPENRRRAFSGAKGVRARLGRQRHSAGRVAVQPVAGDRSSYATARLVVVTAGLKTISRRRKGSRERGFVEAADQQLALPGRCSRRPRQRCQARWFQSRPGPRRAACVRACKPQSAMGPKRAKAEAEPRWRRRAGLLGGFGVDEARCAGTASVGVKARGLARPQKRTAP